jgi:biopolymer transport protein ExbB
MFFYTITSDTIANAASNVVIEKLLKYRNFHFGIPFKRRYLAYPNWYSIVLYFFYVIIERYLYISKASKIDSLLMRDIRDNLWKSLARSYCWKEGK